MIPIKYLILALIALTFTLQSVAQDKPAMKDEQTTEFQGELKIGKRYVAAIETNDKSLSFQPLERLKLPAHHGGMIEWTNLAELGMYYPLSESRKTQFVFEVVSEEVRYRATRSWSTTYFCRVLEIKTDTKGLGAQHYKAFVFAGKCRNVFPTGKRHQSYVFTFDILRVIANGENITGKRNLDFKRAVAQGKITFERFAGLGGNDLLTRLGGSKLIDRINNPIEKGEKFKWDSEKEIEVTILFIADEEK